MVKTFEKYHNDPETTHETPVLRKIHAIRLQTHDERQGLSVAEYNALVDKRAAEFLAAAFVRNKPSVVDMGGKETGRGKLN
jgi:hypothetical protein